MNTNIDPNRTGITVAQAIKQTGFSKSYINYLIKNKKVEAYKFTRDWVVYADSLEAFVTSDRKPGPKGPKKKKVETQIEQA